MIAPEQPNGGGEMDDGSGYEMLEHTGDLRIRAHGSSLEAVFIASAVGMTAYLFGDESVRQQSEGKEVIAIESLDRHSLLVDWLAELLYRSAVHRRAYYPFHFQRLTEQDLLVSAEWRRATAIEEIKAVTYHGLEVAQRTGRGGWEATVVYDL